MKNSNIFNLINMLEMYSKNAIKSNNDLKSFIDKNLKFYDVFNKILDPKNLGVKISKYNELKNTNYEVWIDKPAVLINFNALSKFGIK